MSGPMHGASAVWAVIPAGGTGSRYSATDDKLMARIDGQPVLLRTLQAILAAPSIAGVMLACGEANLARYQALIAEALPDAPILFTTGGPTRRDSVYNALLALNAAKPSETIEVVAVHDAARPCISPHLVEEAIEAIAQGAVGAVVAVPMVDTVKQVHPTALTIERTPARSTLWKAQTPQVFRMEALLRAHQAVDPAIPVTDDAQLLELAGLGPVRIIPGEERNIKITTPGDIVIAEAFLRGTASALL